MEVTQPEYRRWTWTAGRLLAVVVAIVIALFWLWVFAGGPRRQNPDFLTDRSWVKSADATCAVTQDAIKALPGAEESANSTVRAVTVDQATDEIDKMINRLEARPPTDAEDATLVKQWLTDYRSYVASRRDYADDLPADPGAKLLYNEKFRKPIDDVITTFAEVNDMPSCVPPGDVS